MQEAVFAGGCFWCTEAVFKRLKGVSRVISGYTGGETQRPSYNEVVNGTTGHYEAIKVAFDPEKISFKDLLYVFFRTHDPTDPSGQGADRGDQYRSAVFYLDKNQKSLAEASLKDAQKEYKLPIATKILPFEKFFEAEGYHQDYYENNKSSGYCRLVIDPKIKKLQEDFKDYLKK